MSTVLVTGATGNVGEAVIRWLLKDNHKVIAAVRDREKAQLKFAKQEHLNFRYFDFSQPDSALEALEAIDIVFLLRPPNIADVDVYIRPFLEEMKEKGVKKVVFLSVQGAERSKVIPHNKIERLITAMKFDYVMLRPSYFMQNLTTELLPDIVANRRIVLPSGKAKFNWIDIEDIAVAAAAVIGAFKKYTGQAIELTGTENLSFYDVADIMNDIIDNPVVFRSVGPLRFYRLKRKEGIVSGKVMVMLMLHFLPRFQAEPRISDNFKRIIGHQPGTVREFVVRNKEFFG